MDTRRGPSWTQLGGYADKARERIESHRAEAELAAVIERSEDRPPASVGIATRFASRIRALIRR